MRYLGIDYGDKKIGLALGDSETRVAVPLEVIQNTDVVYQTIADLIKSEAIDQVVVGVPLSTTEGPGSPQLEKTRQFIKELRHFVSISIDEEDERYTTAESIRLQREESAGAEEDALAAMLILQAYLDQKRSGRL
ncbi:MAG: Holliday junction resolvase RuvX [Candidatus Uhrbacteria bacterium]